MSNEKYSQVNTASFSFDFHLHLHIQLRIHLHLPSITILAWMAIRLLHILLILIAITTHPTHW